MSVSLLQRLVLLGCYDKCKLGCLEFFFFAMFCVLSSYEKLGREERRRREELLNKQALWNLSWHLRDPSSKNGQNCSALLCSLSHKRNWCVKKLYVACTVWYTMSGDLSLYRDSFYGDFTVLLPLPTNAQHMLGTLSMLRHQMFRLPGHVLPRHRTCPPCVRSHALCVWSGIWYASKPNFREWLMISHICRLLSWLMLRVPKAAIRFNEADYDAINGRCDVRPRPRNCRAGRQPRRRN